MRIRTPAAITTAVTAGMLLSSLLLPAAQADAATFPQLASSTVTRTGTGLGFDAGFASSTALTGVQAYFYSQTSSAVYGPITLNLTSGDGTTGVWTAAPGFGQSIALPHDSYTIELVTTDSDGTQHRVQDIYASPLDYQPTPDFPALAFSPTALGYGNETVTATGRATTYEPESGDVGSAWSAPLKLTLSLGASAPVTTNTAADGSFKASIKALDITATAAALLQETHAVGSASVTSTVGSQSIAMPSPLPTRVLLDQSSAVGLTAGTHHTITGTVQYQTGGQWYPLAGASVDDSGLSEVTTNSVGRFSLSDVVPYQSTGTTQLTVDPLDTFLQGATAGYRYTGVREQMHIDIQQVHEYANSQLSLAGGDGGDGAAPGGLFALEQSPNGKTGWATLRWITLPKSGAINVILPPVTDPHGYWRLYSPTKTGYTSAVSNTVHVFRWANRITGARPSTTRIAAGGTISFSGTLEQQGYSPTWQPTAHQPMVLMFLPDGSKTWQLTTAYAQTNAKGQFVIRGRATKSGIWQVRDGIAETSQFTDAAGPAVHVSVD